MRKGLIRAYGLFWRRDEVDWFPGGGAGPGKGPKFRLLGRIGKNAGTISVADFREQKGIYILHGNYGTYYVGLTLGRTQSLGKRLQDHLKDHHDGEWDRFSWFGFRQVLSQCDKRGINQLRAMPALSGIQVPSLIRDTEALLLRALSPVGNDSITKFAEADEWTQIKMLETESYLAKL